MSSARRGRGGGARGASKTASFNRDEERKREARKLRFGSPVPNPAQKDEPARSQGNGTRGESARSQKQSGRQTTPTGSSGGPPRTQKKQNGARGAQGQPPKPVQRRLQPPSQHTSKSKSDGSCFADSNGSSTQVSGVHSTTSSAGYDQRFKEARDNRHQLRRDAIAQGFLVDPEKPRKLTDAVTPVGTCLDMCPEYERLERITQSDIWAPECDPESLRSGIRKAVEARMVKKFRRSAAGTDEQLPSDLRPPGVLKNTVDFLFNTVLAEAESLAAVHHFLWDRTRGVRNDFSIQQVSKVPDLRVAIDCFERIARFHILSLHQLAHREKPYEMYDWKQELEQLGKTLLSLMQYYDDSKDRYRSKNEAEFRAYCIILQMHEPKPDLEHRVQTWRREVFRDPRVQTAMNIYNAAQNTQDHKGPLDPNKRQLIAQENWARFWSLVGGREVSYLMACAAEPHFNRIRQMALQNIWNVYRPNKTQNIVIKDWTPADLRLPLGFDYEEDAQAYCESFGFEFHRRDDEKLYLDLNSIRGKELPAQAVSWPKQLFSRRLVERKRYHRTFVEVIDNVTIRASQKARGVSPRVSSLLEEAKEDHDDPLFIPEEVNGVAVAAAATTTAGSTLSLNPFVHPLATDTAVTWGKPSGLLSETATDSGPSSSIWKSSSPSPFTSTSLKTAQTTARKSEFFSSTLSNPPTLVTQSPFPQPPSANQALLGGLSSQGIGFPTHSPTPKLDLGQFMGTGSNGASGISMPLTSKLGSPPPTINTPLAKNERPQVNPFGYSISQPPFSILPAPPKQPNIPVAQTSLASGGDVLNSSQASSLSQSQLLKGSRESALKTPGGPSPFDPQPFKQSGEGVFSSPSGPRPSDPTTPAPNAQEKQLLLKANFPSLPSSSNPTTPPLSAPKFPLSTPASPKGPSEEELAQARLKEAQVARSRALDSLADQYFMTPDDGLLHQFIQYYASSIILETQAQHREEVIAEEVREFRYRTLARRYVKRWQALAWLKRRNRRRSERRKRIEALSHQPQSPDPDNKVERLFEMLSSKDTTGAERIAVARMTPHQDTRNEEASSTSDSTVHLQTSRNGEQPLPPKRYRAHRRAKTQSSLPPPNPQYHASKQPGSPSASTMSGRSSLLGASFLSGASLLDELGYIPTGRTSTTRTNYFRLKALGINENEWKRTPLSRKRQRLEEGLDDVPNVLRRRLSGPWEGTTSQVEDLRRRSSGSFSISRHETPQSRPSPAPKLGGGYDELLTRLRKVRDELMEGADWYREEREKEEKKQQRLITQSQSGSPTGNGNFSVTTNGYSRDGESHLTLPPHTKPAFWSRDSKFVPREDYARAMQVAKQRVTAEQSLKASASRALSTSEVSYPVDPHLIQPLNFGSSFSSSFSDFHGQPNFAEGVSTNPMDPLGLPPLAGNAIDNQDWHAASPSMSHRTPWTQDGSASLAGMPVNGTCSGMTDGVANTSGRIGGGTSVDDAIEL